MLAIGSASTDGAGTTTTGNSRREVVSRSSGLFTGASGKERASAERVPTPTDEIRRYWNMYQTVPLVRASFNQFRDDVMANGYRAEAETESAESYLENWSDTAATVGAERNRDMHAIFREIPVQLMARGTVLLEHSPAEADDSRTAGVQFIHPATVTPYRASDTNLLLRPDDTQYDGAKLTEDGEAAAYVQFDSGPNQDSDDERRLTLEDVTRLTIDADPQEIFGTSRVAPVADRIDAVIEKLENNDRAVELNAWRSWFVGFGHETVANEDGSETIVEWADDDMSSFMDDLTSVEPGDIEGHDGTIDIKEVGGDVANIFDQLRYETHYILSAMPAPTYSIGFESDINQFVVEGQRDRHEQRIDHFRRKIDRGLRPLAQSVLNQASRDSTGARWVLEAPETDSPVLNMTDAEVDRLERYASAFKQVSGGKPRTLLPDEVVRQKILQVESVDDGGEYAGWEPDALTLEELGQGNETFEQLVRDRIDEAELTGGIRGSGGE